MAKKWISICLSIALALSVSPSCIAAESSAAAVEISSAAELKALAEEIKNDSDGGRGKTYCLTANLNLNGEVWESFIGTEEKPFKGSFDGNGKIIENFSIETGPSDEKSTYAGIFGVIGDNAEIRDLGIENVTVTSKVGGYNENAGAVAGCALGNARIENCYVRRFSVGYRKENSSIGAEINAAGAIAGVVNGDGVIIKNCYATAVNIPDGNVDRDAGIVGSGQNFLRIENCYSDYLVVRAISGLGNRVINSYYSADPPWPWTDSENGECYFGTAVSVEELKGKAGDLGNAYKDGGYLNFGFPVLCREAAGGFANGNGTAAEPYLIESAADLDLLAQQKNTDGVYYKLTCDLNLDGAERTNAVGTEENPFMGCFDGGGHRITNYKVVSSGGAAYGLFAYVSGGGRIYNLGIENVIVELENNTFREVSFGGLAGCLQGDAGIFDCYAKNISFDCRGLAEGKKIGSAGGLVGCADGDGVEVRNCYARNINYESQSIPVENLGDVLGLGKKMISLDYCYAENKIGKTAPEIDVRQCFQKSADEFGRLGIKCLEYQRIPNNWSYDYYISDEAKTAPVLKWENRGGRYMNLISPSDGTVLQDTAFCRTVKTEADSYYRIALSGGYANEAGKLSVSLDGRDLTAEFGDLDFAANGESESKAVYIKTDKSGEAVLKVSADKEFCLDGISIMQIEPEEEKTEIENALTLMDGKTDETYLEKKVCGGAEVFYTSQNGYFDSRGRKLEKNIPGGKESLTDTLTATVKIADILAEKTIEIKLGAQMPYEIVSVLFQNAGENEIYSFSEAEILKSVTLKKNTDKDAVLYTALYDKDGFLTDIKTMNAENGTVNLNQEINNADKLRIFVLENESTAPFIVPKEFYSDTYDSGKATVYTIGGNVAAEDKNGSFGWGRALTEFFDESKVDVCFDYSADCMTAENFFRQYSAELVSRLKPNDVVIFQPYADEKDKTEFYLKEIEKKINIKDAALVLMTPSEPLSAATNDKDSGYAVKRKYALFADCISAYADNRRLPLADINGCITEEMKQNGLAALSARRIWKNQSYDYEHYTQYGAKWVAGFVADSLKKLSLPISEYIIDAEDEKMIDVFSSYNADFDIKSSTGMKPVLSSSIARDGKSVFDRNIITTAGTEEYDGVPIYDINGNDGNDYIVLMDITTTTPVPLEKLKVFWETGTPYQDGPLMYEDKPTRAWAEGFEIYVSDSGKDDTWERVYYADTLKDMVQTEVVSTELWDDSGGVRPFYEFVLDKPVNTRYIRMAIRGMQPWLGDIEIHEIYGYARESLIPSGYYKAEIVQNSHASAVIRGESKIGDNDCPVGRITTIEVTPDSVSEIAAVKVDGVSVSGYQRYNFTMPDHDVRIEIETKTSANESVPLEMTSAEVSGGGTVYGGTVPVITMNFNRRIDFLDKSMVSVNGIKDSELVQHAFKDATDASKAYVVLFSDKLESDMLYTVSLSGIKSMAGMPLSDSADISFKTSGDYRQKTAEVLPEIDWTKNIPQINNLDVYNSKNSTWTQIPAVTQKLRDMGVSGGEGGQWMEALEIDSIDGSLMFAGIDIAGLIRSTDGGKSWHRSYRGFTASGCVDIRIDPNNKNKVLAIGSLSQEPFCGIYLSEDMGETWSHVYSYIFNGQRDCRKQLAWDKSSFDKRTGGSRVAYWSNLYRLKAGLENSDQEYEPLRSHSVGGLIKTVDGGKNWFVVNKEMSDSVIEVHPTKGIVYAGNESGFFRSEDGGVTFTQILSDEPIYGLDVIETRPDYVYVNDSKGVLVSKDCGKTFTRIKADGFPVKTDLSDVRDIVRDLAVSPANPDYMMVDDRNYHRYNNKRYYTHDGGKTWAESSYDSSKDFFFNHSRQHPYAWHPTDENKVWTLGGDWIVSSSDGGKSFIWDNNGNCGTPAGGRINFNPFNTDLIFCGAQDLTGLLSVNGGYTFIPIESEGGFGCTYGNYAADENLLIAAIADGWYTTRKLRVSRDGGKSFEHTGLSLKYGYARRATSFWGSTSDKNTLFAGEYVSHDRAETWKEMNGCQFVMAVNYYHNREIYGLNNEVIVVSYDNGETWYPFSETYLDDEEALRGYGKHCWDIEYDGINDILYYANGSGNSAHNLVRVENNVHKNIGVNVQIQERVGDKWFQLIALDPRHPDILYLGGYGSGQMKCSNSVQRSCDRGESFQIISSMGDEKSVVKGGDSAGSGCETLVVHPKDGTLWMWASGEGLWTFPAPYDN